MRGRDVELFVSQSQRDDADAYERLIGDALKGDPTLFARQDEVEAAWAVVEPVLAVREAPLEYEPGQWGPASAEQLIAGECGWHNPGAHADDWTRSCVEP
jgi:glucose-6-phosphate 1-dehydrogenase